MTNFKEIDLENPMCPHCQSYFFDDMDESDCNTCQEAWEYVQTQMENSAEALMAEQD